jgi:hypothetical protein
MFAGPRNDTYAELLSDPGAAANPKQGITLIETMPFSPTMETISLAFDHATLPSLFRSKGLVNLDLALRGGEASGGPLVTAASWTPTNAAISGDGAAEAKIMAPGEAVVVGASSHGTECAVPDPKPNNARVHSPDSCTAWQDFATKHSTSKAATVESARQSAPAKEMLSNTQSKGRCVYQNDQGQRIDPALPNEIRLDHSLVTELKKRKLCNYHFLKGKCKWLF